MHRRYRAPHRTAKGIPRRTALGLLTGLSGLTLVAGRAPQTPGLAPSPTLARLPREDLLVFRDDSGAPQPVRTAADWLRRREEILRGFASIAGPMPGPERRCPLEVRLEDEADVDTFIRRRITYESEPGSRVEAYLLIPKAALKSGAAPARGVLCLHQTHAAGKKVVVGLGNSPDDEYGVELARRGFICLATPYPWLAGYEPDLKGLGYVSGTMKAIWDNRRGLDVLESLACVRPGNFAAIGHSLGGHNAIFTAVHDDRIRVVVTSCAFDSFVDYMDGDITGWTQERYMPRLADYRRRVAEVPFDFAELIGALAPRAFFANAPQGDTNFRWKSVARIAQAASAVYRLYDATDRLVVRHPDCAHRFPPELRAEALAFIEKYAS